MSSRLTTREMQIPYLFNGSDFDDAVPTKKIYLSARPNKALQRCTLKINRRAIKTAT
jgi:hypothetical protein